MDPISAVGTCVSLVSTAVHLHGELKGNYQDCGRLLERCRIFEPALQQIQSNPSTYKPASGPAYQRLCSNLQETVKFARQFLEPTFYRSLVRAAFRKGYAAEIAKLNLLLTDSATDLGLVQGIDFEQRRREDIEDANACFQHCVDLMLDEISKLGEQSAEQFAQIQANIEANKLYVKDLLNQLGHRRLMPREQVTVNEAMDAMKGQVEKCHREVMTALRQISGKIDGHHRQLSGKMAAHHDEVSEKLAQVQALLALLSEKKQSADKEQKRAKHLSRHLLSLESVTWSQHEVLGKGAFGTVYKGSYQGNQVAVKVIPVMHGAAVDMEKHIRSLENEVILLREVEFPAILHCYGFARDMAAGNFVIVTEVAPLGSLGDLIKHETVSFPDEVKLAWFGDIINAIAFVHSKGIKHGDIKADNFLVFFPCHLKLCDFGLAREQSSSLRASTLGGAVGTMGFMAPELLLTGSTYASDIYAYAMTTVQIMTGDHPRQGNAAQQVQAAVEALAFPQHVVMEAVSATLIRCCSFEARRDDPAELRPTARVVSAEMTSILNLAGGDVRHGMESYQVSSFLLEQKRQSAATVAPSASQSTSVRFSINRTLKQTDEEQKDKKVRARRLAAATAAAQQKAAEDARKEWELQAQKEKEDQARLAAAAAQKKAVEDARKELELQAQKEKEDQARLAMAAAQKKAAEQKAAAVLQQQQRVVSVPQLLSQIDLMAIARSGDARLLQQLDGLGALCHLAADINKLDRFPPPGMHFVFTMTALMIASSRPGNSAVVQVLLKVPGVNVNLPTEENGLSALMWACRIGHAAAVQALLADARVEVNAQTKDGTTSALSLAIYHDHIAVVDLILADARVQVNIKDQHGRTQLDYARAFEKTVIVALLLAKGAVPGK